MNQRTAIDEVRDQYAEAASSSLSNDSVAVRSIAAAFGYSQDELDSLPEQANMGLSCGNPLALANVSPGEVIVDLGCGGGMDVFLAAQKVGPKGKVIGVDMTSEMLDRARAGVAKLELVNVELHQSTIDNLPIEANTVDCIISNCVINLAPDKKAVFREMLRVLKPGGRIAISDIALKQPLPAKVKESVEAYVGCISGAILINDYRAGLLDAGFESVVIIDTGADLNAYANASTSGCCGASNDSTSISKLHDGLASVMKSFNANAFAASVRVHAIKHSDNFAPNPFLKDVLMKTIQVYDKPMCCSTGVCGPQVDPVLPQFAADLDWLKSQGNQVERFNLAQQPMAFIENKEVHQLLGSEGTDCLPLILINGKIVSRKEYPSREVMAGWVSATAAKQLLPVAKSGGCCGSTGCC